MGEVGDGRAVGLGPGAGLDVAHEQRVRLPADQLDQLVAHLEVDRPVADEGLGVVGAPPVEVEAALAGVNPDELSPREALELVYALRSKLKTPETA